MEAKLHGNDPIELLTLDQASEWASRHLRKKVEKSNISYLVQFGKVRKYDQGGAVAVRKSELATYYESFNGRREVRWREKLGEDLNWGLSFDGLREKDTTKHVHRLHPYKGKFIPQLVEYFLDGHTDGFKKECYFKPGDIVLDPFAGSGTTLVQANELGMHAIGIDVSAFNALITNVKIGRVDFGDLRAEIASINQALDRFVSANRNLQFEDALLNALNGFNKRYFPSPEYRIKVNERRIDEDRYGSEKEAEFKPTFDGLLAEYGLKVLQDKRDGFLGKWYLDPVRREIDFVFGRLKEVRNPVTKKILTIVLSRTIRSCRATTHADLGTLKEPVTQTYYCSKHGKICKPLFSMRQWWRRYATDVLERLTEFDRLRVPGAHQKCLRGDSRRIDIFAELERKDEDFAALARRQKIRGIFSSPPYVGLIDYHEQHAYAYELFGFERNDELEIGPLFRGQGREAHASYVEGIVQTLTHAKPYMQEDCEIFLVANDKHNLYPAIAEQSGLEIVNRYKRPVLNRTERSKSAYAETIFHMRRTEPCR